MKRRGEWKRRGSKRGKYSKLDPRDRPANGVADFINTVPRRRMYVLNFVTKPGVIGFDLPGKTDTFKQAFRIKPSDFDVNSINTIQSTRCRVRKCIFMGRLIYPSDAGSDGTASCQMFLSKGTQHASQNVADIPGAVTKFVYPSDSASGNIRCAVKYPEIQSAARQEVTNLDTGTMLTKFFNPQNASNLGLAYFAAEWRSVSGATIGMVFLYHARFEIEVY